MDGELSRVPTRSLLRELALRSPDVLRRRLLRGRLVEPAPAFDRTPFAALEREGRPPVELWAGYRDRIKRGWRSHFWPVRVLLELGRRVDLPEPQGALRDELGRARTLPAPLAEIAAGLEGLAGTHPEHVRVSPRLDPSLGLPMLAVVPTRKELDAKAGYYLASARSLSRVLGAHGLELRESEVLELGCGTGYLTLALGALGARRAVGVDQALDGYYEAVAERELIAERLGAHGELEVADAGGLPYGDGSLDAVVSFSTLEHLVDLPAVLAEALRVLRLGGLSYHVVDPWFGPQGGHSMCTLDFPWGHVRLTGGEVEEYLRRYRPHEEAEAIGFYRHGFQTPRLTLAEIEALVVETGFEILEWNESRRAFPDHAALLDRAVLEDCLAAYPRATVRDLLTDNYTMLLRKR